MSRRKKIVALLPMKAHSERVPGKNFRELAGRPLYQWILNTLISISDISIVVINTDARKILEHDKIIRNKKVLIRDRKSEICGDHISMNRIIADDIDNLDADIYLMTHTTNPFLSRNTIIDCLNIYREMYSVGKYDSLFTVNSLQGRFYTRNLEPINHDPEILMRTQDLDPLLEENSNLYIFNYESFKKSGTRIGKLPYAFPTPRAESFDIDTTEDWTIAELIAESGMMRNNTGLGRG